MGKNRRIIYDKLKIAWENSIKMGLEYDLTEEEFEAFIGLQKEVHNIIKEELPKNMGDTEKEIIKELKKNAAAVIDFMIGDLLNIRKERILRAAENLDVLNGVSLLPVERDFYTNMLAAFKGYSKIRNVISVMADACDRDLLPPDYIKEVPFCTEIEPESTPPSHERPVQQTEIREAKPAVTPRHEAGEDLPFPDPEKIEYIAVKFLKHVDPIVGQDLAIYGPFEPEDVAYLPKSNALILMKEKMAEPFD